MSAGMELREIALSDSGFVFDPRTGSTFTVNATGLSVLRALKDGLSRAGVEGRLRDEFDVVSGDLSRDVDELVEMLRQVGLLGSDFRLR